MPRVIDRVVWTGLNVRAVCRVCRKLLAWNAAHPTNPAIWLIGRSRVEPEANYVTIRGRSGLKKARVGDEIVRYDDDTFDVEPRNES